MCGLSVSNHDILPSTKSVTNTYQKSYVMTESQNFDYRLITG